MSVKVGLKAGRLEDAPIVALFARNKSIPMAKHQVYSRNVLMEVTVAPQTNFMLGVITKKLDITFKMTKWQLQPKRVLLLNRLVLYHLLMMLHGTTTRQ